MTKTQTKAIPKIQTKLTRITSLVDQDSGGEGDGGVGVGGGVGDGGIGVQEATRQSGRGGSGKRGHDASPQWQTLATNDIYISIYTLVFNKG